MIGFRRQISTTAGKSPWLRGGPLQGEGTEGEAASVCWQGTVQQACGTFCRKRQRVGRKKWVQYDRSLFSFEGISQVTQLTIIPVRQEVLCPVRELLLCCSNSRGIVQQRPYVLAIVVCSMLWMHGDFSDKKGNMWPPRAFNLSARHNNRQQDQVQYSPTSKRKICFTIVLRSPSRSTKMVHVDHSTTSYAHVRVLLYFISLGPVPSQA